MPDFVLFSWPEVIFQRSVDDLRKRTPAATVLDGFKIRGTRANQAYDGLRAWLRGLGLIES